MTPPLHGKKLKIRDDKLFGQGHVDYKWLTPDSKPVRLQIPFS